MALRANQCATITIASAITLHHARATEQGSAPLRVMQPRFRFRPLPYVALHDRTCHCHMPFPCTLPPPPTPHPPTHPPKHPTPAHILQPSHASPSLPSPPNLSPPALPPTSFSPPPPGAQGGGRRGVRPEADRGGRGAAGQAAGAHTCGSPRRPPPLAWPPFSFPSPRRRVRGPPPAVTCRAAPVMEGGGGSGLAGAQRGRPSGRGHFPRARCCGCRKHLPRLPFFFGGACRKAGLQGTTAVAGAWCGVASPAAAAAPPYTRLNAPDPHPPAPTYPMPRPCIGTAVRVAFLPPPPIPITCMHMHLPRLHRPPTRRTIHHAPCPAKSPLPPLPPCRRC